MIMKERMNEAREKARKFAKEQEKKSRGRS